MANSEKNGKCIPSSIRILPRHFSIRQHQPEHLQKQLQFLTLVSERNGRSQSEKT